MFENVDNTHTRTYIRTTDAYLNYKLTNESKDSGELKTVCITFMPRKKVMIKPVRSLLYKVILYSILSVYLKLVITLNISV